MSLLRNNHVKYLQAVALKFSHHGMLQQAVTTKAFEVGFVLAPVDDSEEEEAQTSIPQPPKV